jgi:aminopeptidase N
VSTFNSTSHLPSYLVAFIISEFDMIASITTANNVALRIFAAPSQQQQTPNAAFALNTTQRALKIFESEFSLQYGIDKLDQVSLPHSGPCSAVNYGISFYRENCLLYDASVSIKEQPLS